MITSGLSEDSVRSRSNKPEDATCMAHMVLMLRLAAREHRKNPGPFAVYCAMLSFLHGILCSSIPS